MEPTWWKQLKDNTMRTYEDVHVWTRLAHNVLRNREKTLCTQRETWERVYRKWSTLWWLVDVTLLVQNLHPEDCWRRHANAYKSWKLLRSRNLVRNCLRSFPERFHLWSGICSSSMIYALPKTSRYSSSGISSRGGPMYRFNDETRKTLCIVHEGGILSCIETSWMTLLIRKDLKLWKDNLGHHFPTNFGQCFIIRRYTQSPETSLGDLLAWWV